MSSSHTCRVSRSQVQAAEDADRPTRQPICSTHCPVQTAAPRGPWSFAGQAQFGIPSPPLIGLYHIDIISYVFLYLFDPNPPSLF